MKLEFTAQPVFSRGTSTLSVTRTVVQARGLVDAFPLSGSQKEGILNVSMTLMKHFIACEEVRDRVGAQVAAGRTAIDREQVSAERERFLKLPAVLNLESEVEAYLHNAKLGLADVGRLFGPLHGQEFNHKFQKIRSWLRIAYGEEDPLLLVLTGDSAWIERVINMRNVVEHPDDPSGPLIVRNFAAVQQDPLTIANPMWALGTEPLVNLVEDMGVIIDNILTLYEDVLSDGIVRIAANSPFTIIEIPEADRDAETPIRLVPALKTMPPSA